MDTEGSSSDGGGSKLHSVRLSQLQHTKLCVRPTISYTLQVGYFKRKFLNSNFVFYYLKTEQNWKGLINKLFIKFVQTTLLNSFISKN